MELIKVNGKEPDKDRKKNEDKRKKKFIKETQKQKDLTLENKMEVTWDDLVEKYDFFSKEPEAGFAYVISFHPKPGKKKERNRMEKILNHISGTIWVDADFYVLKARVHLLENVKYGLGILANVENVELQFAQKKVADVWLPDTYHLKYKARVLVKTRTREIYARFFDFAPRNPAAASSAQ
jgi:hypothetical protein